MLPELRIRLLLLFMTPAYLTLNMSQSLVHVRSALNSSIALLALQLQLKRHRNEVVCQIYTTNIMHVGHQERRHDRTVTSGAICVQDNCNAQPSSRTLPLLPDFCDASMASLTCSSGYLSPAWATTR